MPRWALVLLVAAGIWGGWDHWRHRELTRPPGVLVADEPQQRRLPAGTPEIVHGRYRLAPQARYRIQARLLSRTRYRFDDGAELAPLDFAVGWGPMSDSAVLEGLSISQSNRFFHWSTAAFPIPRADIEHHAANMHLIAADAGVARVLDTMRAGQVVVLEGRLVNALRDDGWKWNSSLTRTDSGAGACELMWVEQARIVES